MGYAREEERGLDFGVLGGKGREGWEREGENEEALQMTDHVNWCIYGNGHRFYEHVISGCATVTHSTSNIGSFEVFERLNALRGAGID